jgi:hypothetical protein
MWRLQKGSQKPETFPPVDQEFEATSPAVMHHSTQDDRSIKILQTTFYHG